MHPTHWHPNHGLVKSKWFLIPNLFLKGRLQASVKTIWWNQSVRLQRKYAKVLLNQVTLNHDTGWWRCSPFSYLTADWQTGFSKVKPGRYQPWELNPRKQSSGDIISYDQIIENLVLGRLCWNKNWAEGTAPSCHPYHTLMCCGCPIQVSGTKPLNSSMKEFRHIIDKVIYNMLYLRLFEYIQHEYTEYTYDYHYIISYYIIYIPSW